MKLKNHAIIVAVAMMASTPWTMAQNSPDPGRQDRPQPDQRTQQDRQQDKPGQSGQSGQERQNQPRQDPFQQRQGSQPGQANQQPGERQPGQFGQRQQPGQGFRQVHKVNDVMGKEVQNAQGEKIGKIKDLAVDTDRERVVYAVLEPEGKMAQGKYLAVPIPVLQLDQEKDVLILAVTKEQITNAQGFDEENWPNQPSSMWGARTQFDPQQRNQLDQQGQSDPLGQERRQDQFNQQQRQGQPRQDQFNQQQRQDQPRQDQFDQQQRQDQPRQGQSGRESATIRLNEEQLDVRTREVPAGGVRVQTEVNEREVSKPVELERETVEINRRPGQGEQPSENPFRERDVTLPLQKEEAEAQKKTSVKEVVEVKTPTETEQSKVTGTVREEQIKINREGQQNASQIQGQEGQSAQAQSQRPADRMMRQRIESALVKKEGSESNATAVRQPGQPGQDQKNFLSKEQWEKIQVTAQGGTVKLSGEVESEEMKGKITKAVQGLPGIQAVDNELKVKKAGQQ